MASKTHDDRVTELATKVVEHYRRRKGHTVQGRQVSLVASVYVVCKNLSAKMTAEVESHALTLLGR